MRLRDRVRAALGLREGDVVGKRAGRLHRFAVVLAVLLVAAGTVVTRLPVPFAPLGVLLASAAISTWIAERVVSVLYGFPLSEDWLPRSFVVRHPWLVTLLAATLHVFPPFAAEASLLFRHGPTLSVTTALVFGLIGLPFWLIVFHPRRYFRSTRRLRTE